MTARYNNVVGKLRAAAKRVARLEDYKLTRETLVFQ
jgi:hypothetical protein